MTDEAHDLPPSVIRPIAEAEISEAFRWYEDKSEGLGSEFMRALDACLAKAYSTVYKNVHRSLLRRFPYGVFYIFENKTVVVIACFHASRSPKQWRNRA